VKTIQVLLAEDNAADVYLVEEALRVHHLPYDLRVVKTASEAADYLNRMGTVPEIPCPDIFLADLNLPQGNGHELLAAFRAHPQCRLSPVVIISSSDAPHDRARAQQMGASAYFRKPSDLEKFMELGVLVAGLIAEQASAANAPMCENN
jgi:chemotaxis family two-component system response regulator Rcp1